MTNVDISRRGGVSSAGSSNKPTLNPRRRNREEVSDTLHSQKEPRVNPALELSARSARAKDRNLKKKEYDLELATRKNTQLETKLAQKDTELAQKELENKQLESKIKELANELARLYANESSQEIKVIAVEPQVAKADILERSDNSGNNPKKTLSEEELKIEVDKLCEVVCQAIEEDNVGLVQEKLNELDKIGLNALHYAIQNGNLAMVKLLLEKGAEVGTRDAHNNTNLHFAAEANSLELMQLIFDKGFTNIDAVNEDKWSVLHSAASGIVNKQGEPNWEVINWLLEKGANLSAETDQGWTVSDIFAQEDWSYAKKYEQIRENFFTGALQEAKLK